MRFPKRLLQETQIVREFSENAPFISYTNLAFCIHDLKLSRPGVTEESFHAMLQDDLAKIIAYLREWETSLCKKFRLLEEDYDFGLMYCFDLSEHLFRAQKVFNFTGTFSPLEDLKYRISRLSSPMLSVDDVPLAEEFLIFCKYIEVNISGFRKILKQHDISAPNVLPDHVFGQYLLLLTNTFRALSLIFSFFFPCIAEHKFSEISSIIQTVREVDNPFSHMEDPAVFYKLRE